MTDPGSTPGTSPMNAAESGNQSGGGPVGAVSTKAPESGDQSGGLISTILGYDKAAHGFWSRWGLTDGLLTLGLIVTAFGIAATIDGLGRWSADDMFAALAFGALALALGMVSMIFRSRFTAVHEDRRARVFEVNCIIRQGSMRSQRKPETTWRSNSCWMS